MEHFHKCKSPVPHALTPPHSIRNLLVSKKRIKSGFVCPQSSFPLDLSPFEMSFAPEIYWSCSHMASSCEYLCSQTMISGSVLEPVQWFPGENLAGLWCRVERSSYHVLMEYQVIAILWNILKLFRICKCSFLQISEHMSMRLCLSKVLFLYPIILITWLAATCSSSCVFSALLPSFLEIVKCFRFNIMSEISIDQICISLYFVLISTCF